MATIIKENSATIKINNTIKTVSRYEVEEIIESAADMENCINMLMYQLNVDENTAYALITPDEE